MLLISSLDLKPSIMGNFFVLLLLVHMYIIALIKFFYLFAVVNPSVPTLVDLMTNVGIVIPAKSKELAIQLGLHMSTICSIQ